MSCPRCGRANRAGARFCGGCGAALAPRCPACGRANEADTRFCDACGAALAAAPPEAEADAVARKVVTIVFADLIGSTALHERLDPESVSRVMEAYHAAVRAPIEAHGGAVVQLLGDGVMCAFGVPQVAEDDALRAVRAGVAVQASFRAFLAERPELAGKVGLRVAVNTGEVVVSDDYAAGIGDPLNVAARLQQEARDGDVLVGGTTQRHVRERVTLERVGDFALKGRVEPVAAYRVVSLERPAGAAAVPFVGREDELRRLQAVYEAAVAKPAAHLAVVLGSPGLGKSRLVAEWVARLADGATVLSARCESGRGATFAPLAAALRELLGPHGDPAVRIEGLLPADEGERTRVAAGVAALLAGEPALPQETFFVVRRFLAALAKSKPVLLLIDDLHWAEPLLLDLVEHLVQWGAGVELLVLAVARPELRALRSALATPGPLAHDVVTLAGLDAAAATQLAARVIGAEALPAALAGRVLAASEGNPLFLAELVRMLVDDGVLRREGEDWIAADGIADFPMPPSIQALLAARIERLAPGERTLLERAAIVGRRFSRAALVALLPREGGDLDARLEALRRSELIEPDPGWLFGEPALRFHHALIRDAAYRRVLKNTRAELHARSAGWIEERAGEAVEHDETIGWHFEQAHQNLRELGPLDERGHEFGARAARHLGAAGQRALARDDLPLAAGLLGRALERLAPESPARIELLLDHCEALLATGEVTAATRAVAELGRLASGSERLRAWQVCFAGQLAALTDPDALRATAEAAAAAAETLAAAGDAVGEAKAHSVHAAALARLGAIGACEAALDRALAAARRAHDRRRANAVLAGAPLAALFGPSPVTRASGRCLDVVRVLRITQGAPGVEAVALRCQAVLEALRGRLDAARRMISYSRKLVEELGIGQQLLECDVFAGWIEWLAGDSVAAERWLRDAYTGLRQRGLRIDAARAAAQLGRVLLAEGRARDAEALSHESETLAGDDLQAAIAWRGVRAEALAMRGEHAAAAELARSAIEIASATDALLHHADARRALAAVLAAAGRAAEAAQEEARALELLEAKGATLLAEQTRRTTDVITRSVSHEAAGGRPRATRRRDERNDATLLMQRIDEAVAARDLDRVRSHLREDAQVLDRVHGSSYGSDTLLDRFRWMIERSAGLAFANQPIAVLGASLALADWRETGSEAAAGDLAVGSYEIGGVVLIEADSEPRLVRVESFARDELGDAVARLYARHAELLPEGPERTRADTTAHAVAAWLERESRVDRFDGHVSASLEFRDHRRGGFGGVSGDRAFLRGHRSLHELARDVTLAVHDVLGLRPDAFLLRTTTSGTDRAGGGTFERPLLLLGTFGADGLLARVEWFEPERPDAALTRFDAAAAEPPAGRFENAVTRSEEVFARLWDAGDWAAWAALTPPGFRSIDRRPLMHLEVDGETMLRGIRPFFEMRAERASQLLATRGKRLALFRMRLSTRDAAEGPSEVEFLQVIEVDERGRRSAAVAFGSADLDAAHAELDARYAAGEAAAHPRAAATMQAFVAAFARRDWDALGALFAEEVGVRDQRRLGWEPLSGRRAYVDSLRSLVELAPDVRLRLDHARLSERGVFWVASWTGTQEGGPFETPWVIVSEHDAAGVVQRFDQYDVDRLDAALGRFTELGADPLAIPPNAAVRTSELIRTHALAGDWEALRGLCAPIVFEDRRRLLRTVGGCDALVANARQIGRSAWERVTRTLLATAGERLALTRNRWTGREGGTAVEIETLEVMELDAGARIVASITFDPEDRRAAFEELQARFAAGEAAAHPGQDAIARMTRAFSHHDWDALRECFHPDGVTRDHRTLGLGELTAEGWIESLRAYLEFSSDVRLEPFRILAWGAHGRVSLVRVRGTRDGGAFENVLVALAALRDERIARYEFFDVDDAGRALARFEELGAGTG